MLNRRKDGFSGAVQSLLILILLLLLLLTSSISVSYLVQSASHEARYELLREERKMLLRNLETEIKDGVERQLVIIEGRIFTIEKRVDHLEYRVLLPIEDTNYKTN